LQDGNANRMKEQFKAWLKKRSRSYVDVMSLSWGPVERTPESTHSDKPPEFGSLSVGPQPKCAAH
jgi:hypothetical protein